MFWNVGTSTASHESFCRLLRRWSNEAKTPLPVPHSTTSCWSQHASGLFCNRAEAPLVQASSSTEVRYSCDIWKECPCESVPKRNTYTWLTTTCHDTCYLFWMVSPSSKHLLYNSLMSAVGKLFNKAPRGSSTCSQNSLTKNFFIWLFCLLYLYFLSPVSFWQRSIYTLEAGWASDVFDLSRIEGVLCTQLSRRSCYFWPLHDKQYFHVCVWISSDLSLYNLLSG